MIIETPNKGRKQSLKWLGHSPYYYRTPWCEMLRCCSTHDSVLHMWYKLEDLAKEIDMLTSTLGSKRASEQSVHLLDLINMTDDEKRQFMSFARTAMSRVFQAFCKYTKGLVPAYIFNEGEDTLVIEGSELPVPPVPVHKGQWVEFDGDLYVSLDDDTTDNLSNFDKQLEDFRFSIHYIMPFPANLNRSVLPALDQCIFDALKYYIIAEWLHMAYPDEEKAFRLRYEESMDEMKRFLRRLIDVVIDRIPRVF